MRLVTVRELRSRTASLFNELSEAGELVITSNGRPVALLTPLREAGFEDELAALRRMRATLALNELQRRSVQEGLDRLSEEAIEREIEHTRRERKA
jgi:prevent-host-death family protein